jgi:hypothetical protein
MISQQFSDFTHVRTYRPISENSVNMSTSIIQINSRNLMLQSRVQTQDPDVIPPQPFSSLGRIVYSTEKYASLSFIHKTSRRIRDTSFHSMPEFHTS